MLAARRVLGTASGKKTWPQLPALSANSFVDHFDAGSLDTTKWTAVTTGTGSVSLSDSNLVTDSVAANQAAFVYYNTQLNLSKSQLWMACVKSNVDWSTNGQLGHCLRLLNGSSAPAADTTANINAKTLLELVFGVPSSTPTLMARYFSSGSVSEWWDATTPGFENPQTTNGWLVSPVQSVNDYYVLGIEIDGVNSRVRMMCWGIAFATAGTMPSPTYNQGWRLTGLTDWVNWSSVRSSANVWLTLGHAVTDATGQATMEFEWVRYAEAPAGNTVIDGWMVGHQNSATDAQTRHVYSYDGQIFIPQDRTSWAIPLGSTYDAVEAGDPCCVYDGASTDWLFYKSTSAVPAFSISVTSAAHVTAGTGQSGPWTKYASNPLISQGTSGAYDDYQINAPFVVMDKNEPNPNFLWKMLYQGMRNSDRLWRILYATAPAPTGPWTKQGLVIDVGTTGANDAGGCNFPVIVRYQGLWYVFYEGWDSARFSHLMWATGSTLGSLAKQGTQFSPTNVYQALTANLNTAPGRTVTVGNTAGFVKDAAVLFSQSANSDTWSSSRIRKIVSSTVLELYHGLTGFLTTNSPPAEVIQVANCPNVVYRAIILDRTGTWRFYLGWWEPFGASPLAPTYSAVYEELAYHTHTAASPVGAAPALQALPYVTSRGFNNDQESFENLTLLYSPVTA